MRCQLREERVVLLLPFYIARKLSNVSSDYPRLLPIGTQVAQAEVRSTRDICIGHDYYSG